MICEHLQPPRYEDEATLNYYARRRAAHRPAAAVKMVSRGLKSLMTRTARVVRASDSPLAWFAAQTHQHAELFEADAAPSQGPWVTDEALRSLHKVMPRLRAVGLYCGYYTSKGVEALIATTKIEAYHQHDTRVTSAICRAVQRICNLLPNSLLASIPSK